jgi:enoyl-CoA hydratase/carnithine racemase
MSTLVSYEIDGHVATITYNRPDVLNAINAEMRRALNDAFGRFRDDEEAWVAIVTGAGRAFCAGGDIHDGAGATGEFAGTFWEKPTTNSFESGWEIYKPVIAAVNGLCLGYGLTLVNWCDFVIASDQAEFGFPEVRLGVPTIVGAIRLPQKISWQYAMELLLTGERIDAERAKEIGRAAQSADGRGTIPRPSTVGCGPPGRSGHQGGGCAITESFSRRSHPIRRDHAPGGHGHRGHWGRSPCRQGTPGAPVAGPLTRQVRVSTPARICCTDHGVGHRRPACPESVPTALVKGIYVRRARGLPLNAFQVI